MADSTSSGATAATATSSCLSGTLPSTDCRPWSTRSRRACPACTTAPPAECQGQADVADNDLLDAMSATNNELVSMHREVAQANAELDKLNRCNDEIMAMVAHEHDAGHPPPAVATSPSW